LRQTERAGLPELRPALSNWQSVDLHAQLTRHLQSGNNPPQAKRIATFSKSQVKADRSFFDASMRRYRLRFRCKSTIEISQSRIKRLVRYEPRFFFKANSAGFLRGPSPITWLAIRAATIFRGRDSITSAGKMRAAVAFGGLLDAARSSA
jgi:hypothetical protein